MLANHQLEDIKAIVLSYHIRQQSTKSNNKCVSIYKYNTFNNYVSN